MTRAVPLVAKKAGVTRKAARAALEATHDGEWHHTGKYANRIDYYDVSEAVEYLAAQSWLDKLPDDWEARLSAAVVRGGNSLDDRGREIDKEAASLAAVAGVTEEDILHAWYSWH